MASLAELSTIEGTTIADDSWDKLVGKVAAALVKKAASVRAAHATTPVSAVRQQWAIDVIQHPMATALWLTRAAVGETVNTAPTVTITQILQAGDGAIESIVNSWVDFIAPNP